MKHEILKHPSHPEGIRHAYLQENVARALADLTAPGGTWRKRILEACWKTQRTKDTELFTYYMSDSTLAAWRDCDPARFQKADDDLSDEEIAELAGALRCYLRGAAIDEGIRLAGQDPREFDQIGRVTSRAEAEERPERY